MPRIQYIDDVGGNFQETHGSDGRLNVSSRSDSRAYYNSRDQGLYFSLSFNHPDAVNGEYSFYWKNTSSTKILVLQSVFINSDLGANCKLWFVTGAAGDGGIITPTNLNTSSEHAAEATALEDGGGTTISGLVTAGIIAYDKIPVDNREKMRPCDTIRIGQNKAIALEVDLVTSGTPHVFGTAYGYYE